MGLISIVLFVSLRNKWIWSASVFLLLYGMISNHNVFTYLEVKKLFN